MQYSTTEARGGHALILPVAEFAPDEDEFLARINPFLDEPAESLETFAEDYGYDYYAPENVEDATLDGEELDADLGVLVRFADETGETDTAPFSEWEFEQALNVRPDQYIGEVNVVGATQYGSTSYSF